MKAIGDKAMPKGKLDEMKEAGISGLSGVIGAGDPPAMSDSATDTGEDAWKKSDYATKTGKKSDHKAAMEAHHSAEKKHAAAFSKCAGMGQCEQANYHKKMANQHSHEGSMQRGHAKTGTQGHGLNGMGEDSDDASDESSDSMSM